MQKDIEEAVPADDQKAQVKEKEVVKEKVV